ncbi:AraC family transcriptional regulator [Sphingobium sp. SA916]|uniref:helix-turn-helix domain-containing protein n=1 Tax=Sphingobium sp. SA916 TaxID=1851207 RepID=UPI00209C1735|nr:AraC family transcriptional regulator [Sphingobium sp. SA916]
MAKSFMLDRLASPVAIADIASNCRLSVSYFERAFANSVGVAPYAWLLEQRLTRAKNMLGGAAVPIAQIALDCGFVDQAHFTNTFSRKIGLTPGKWRSENSPGRL